MVCPHGSSAVLCCSYDTIMCLSVTKWIHLNGGDATLKAFFKKLYNSLTPGVGG